ncbi:MAG TPA: SDR family oxidoreductase [Afifellaceae bacterium]|nr:SDR family oxidoreductase [Afifellaceae bacterium]
MRILLTGANGFIGSAVLAALRREGHEVVAVVRSQRSARRLPSVQIVRIDIAEARRPQDWLPHLDGIDAVVNCAGVLRDGAGDSTAGVHHHGVAALFEACERAGVRRVVHLSAIGVDRDTPTDFSRTKRAGDEALMRRELDWVILRPSVVLGRAAYGGSALIRGLAGLPAVPVIGEAGELQVVQLDDLVQTILFFLKPGAPARVAIDVAGPQRLPFTEVVMSYRRWLGWGEGPLLPVPRWVAAVMYRKGDAARWLGWRTPINSTARREIGRGAVGEAGEWSQLTGIRPQRLEEALAAEPASVQERWFARLYFLKPLVLGVLAFFWIMTGIISLGPGWEIGVELMRTATIDTLAAPGVIAGALADILIGVAIAFRRTARPGLYAALALSVFYAVTGTLLMPSLWIDPIGPMLKIVPIIVLHFVALAMLDDR